MEKIAERAVVTSEQIDDNAQVLFGVDDISVATSKKLSLEELLDYFETKYGL